MAVAAVRLAQGTKEYVNAVVTDETGVVTTLVGTSPKFDVVVVDNGGADPVGTVKQNDVNCLVTDMTLQALVDTNAGGLWALGFYQIFYFWTIGSEVPREGPFDIYVI
jgi:hypothetical protein